MEPKHRIIPREAAPKKNLVSNNCSTKVTWMRQITQILVIENTWRKFLWWILRRKVVRQLITSSKSVDKPSTRNSWMSKMTYLCKKDASTLNTFPIKPFKLGIIFIIGRWMLGVITLATLSKHKVRLLLIHRELSMLLIVTVVSSWPKDYLKSQSKSFPSHFHFSLDISRPRVSIIVLFRIASHLGLILVINPLWNQILFSRCEQINKTQRTSQTPKVNLPKLGLTVSKMSSMP